MGGQVGDTGELTSAGTFWRVANTQKSGNTFLHFLEEAEDAPAVGDHVTVRVDRARRAAIQRHHTVTHLLHWALHEVVSQEATQKGSLVNPEKLTFDFNSGALTPEQVRDVERLVNERVLENAPVSWIEVPYADVRGRGDIMQAFGDKYGDQVRVVQIGGEPGSLTGYSMELCGGTHTRHTGEVGLFRIVSEGAVAAGVRRIEAIAGLTAHEQAVADTERLKQLAAALGTPLPELEKKLAALLGQQKELERQLESLRKKQAAATAVQLDHKAQTLGGTPAIVEKVDGATGDDLQQIADALKASAFKGVVLLAGTAGDQVALLASVSPEYTAKLQAGKLIQALAPIVGGKGGGRPDSARGAGKEVAKAGEALEKAKALIAGG
jgi:alanyl-tRNA synthetase